MSETGSAAASHGILPRAVLPLVSARTWLALIHLLAGIWTGLAAILVIITGIALGVGLLPIFLIGVAILAATYWLCGQFAVM